MKLNHMHVLGYMLGAEEALFCCVGTRWTQWLFFQFLGENSVHMGWNQHIVLWAWVAALCPIPHSTLFCFINIKSTGECKDVCVWSVSALYLSAEPLGIQKPKFFSLSCRVETDAILKREAVCHSRSSQQFKEKKKQMFCCSADDLLFIIQQTVDIIYSWTNCANERSVDSIVWIVDSKPALLGALILAA